MLHTLLYMWLYLLISFLAVLFLYFILYLLWPCFVYLMFRQCLCKRKNLKKAGEWAIVTGSTSGIGRAFAEILAKEGLNIFLISRDVTKLEKVAGELENIYKVKTRIFVADLAKVCSNYIIVNILPVHFWCPKSIFRQISRMNNCAQKLSLYQQFPVW